MEIIQICSNNSSWKKHGACGRQSKNPQRSPRPSAGNLCLWPLTWHRGLCRVMNLGGPETGHSPGLSMWPRYIHKGPHQREAGGSEGSRDVMIEAEVRGVWRHEPGNSSSLQKLKKTGHIFLLGHPEGKLSLVLAHHFGFLTSRTAG